MPKILFVKQYHYLKHTGGAETQAGYMAMEFARRGWEVHFASEWNELREPKVVEGVTLHGLPENPAGKEMNREPLKKLMQELKPDVVYNRAFDLYTAHSLLDAPKNSFKVWSAAGFYEGYYLTFLKQAFETTKLHQFVRRLPQLIHRRYWADKGRRNADLILAQHKEQQEIFRNLGMESVLIRNSHEIVPQSEVQTHEGTPTVLWVSSVKQWKRPELFLELAKRMQDTEAKFVMVGGISEAKKYNPLMDEAKKSLKNFEYAGFVPYAEVGKYFAKGHIFVSTSFSEGFSNTFIQAWIHGVPVVSLGVDPENLLRDEKLGTRTESLEEMEKEIRRLLSDAAQRKAIGKRAREFSLREFDLKANADKLESLIKQGMEKKLQLTNRG